MPRLLGPGDDPNTYEVTVTYRINIMAADREELRRKIMELPKDHYATRFDSTTNGPCLEIFGYDEDTGEPIFEDDEHITDRDGVMVLKRNTDPEDYNPANFGHTKGDVCGRGGCDGILNEHYTDTGCSCHINPPCSHCTTERGYCPVCGWDSQDD